MPNSIRAAKHIIMTQSSTRLAMMRVVVKFCSIRPQLKANKSNNRVIRYFPTKLKEAALLLKLFSGLIHPIHNNIITYIAPVVILQQQFRFQNYKSNSTMPGLRDMRKIRIAE